MPKSPADIVLVGPAMESLLARSTDSFWPSKVLHDPGIIRETHLRQTLSAKLCALFERVPDPAMDIVTAVENGLVEEVALAELYDLLAAFLRDEPLNRRLVLYLPFELLPAKSWHGATDALRRSSENFVRAYLERWRELLDITDVRANFVDGNILEKELAPDGQPLVRKAAHLTPQLVRKGLVTLAEAKALWNGTANPILEESLSEALAALDAGSTSLDRTERNFGREQLEKLPEEMVFELEKLDMREALDHSRGMPPARVAWERRNNEDVLITRYAERLAKAITSGRTEWSDLVPLLRRENPGAVRLAAVRGIGVAVERLAPKSQMYASTLANAFVAHHAGIEKIPPDVSDELEGILARWACLGVIEKSVLNGFGFTLPELDAGFSTNSALSKELRMFSDTIDAIARDPEYSRLLYPVAFFFGSRLKGYAKRNADLDAGVFVRPGVSPRERPKIRKMLARLFPDKRIDGKVVEFWLEERGGALAIRDFEDADVFLADSTWVHLLLSSVWLGKDAVIKELYAALLPGFLSVDGKMFMGRDLRTLCLDEMEREVLQYRLMHKGYWRFFPRSGGIDKAAAGLGPESAFWDSGYRRLATKLFISRVFLPQLNTIKKNGQ